jgi:hypothetical protein
MSAEDPAGVVRTPALLQHAAVVISRCCQPKVVRTPAPQNGLQRLRSRLGANSIECAEPCTMHAA